MKAGGQGRDTAFGITWVRTGCKTTVAGHLLAAGAASGKSVLDEGHEQGDGDHQDNRRAGHVARDELGIAGVEKFGDKDAQFAADDKRIADVGQRLDKNDEKSDRQRITDRRQDDAAQHFATTGAEHAGNVELHAADRVERTERQKIGDRKKRQHLRHR